MIDLSHTPYMLFGCGGRQKYVCTPSCLCEWPGGKVVERYAASTFEIDITEYSVSIDGPEIGKIRICEDEQGVRIERGGSTEYLTELPVSLPGFEDHANGNLLKALHHEILVNIVDGAPLPNALVYDKPWYRDGAMVAMVLLKTGNIDLIKDWILSIRDPFDRNNAGHEEPDNLGEVLYLVSLVSDTAHPVVDSVIDAVEKIRKGPFITGITDGQKHPVYQTKWLAFGLRHLGITHDFSIPLVEDSYGALCWFDKEEITIPSDKRYFSGTEDYPYLTWAECHFHNDSPPMQLLADSYPYTWEARASEATYEGMVWTDKALIKRRLCMPHTWHAAEAFLMLFG